MKRIRLRVVSQAAGSWTVSLERLTEDGPTAFALERSMELVRARNGREPMPRPATGSAEQNDPDYPKQLGDNADLLLTRYERVMRRDASEAESGEFARVLFHTLIGRATWTAMMREVGHDPLELVLSWAPTDWALHRLPWELMRFEAEYLGHRTPLVAISREVPAAAGSGRLGTGGILFAIGVGLDDPEVKPGAEYFAVLRRMQEKHLHGELSLLPAASLERLTEAVHRDRPSVVHIVSHGGFEGGRGYIRLASQDALTTHINVDARKLAVALQGEDGSLPIIVLSACETATTGDGPVGQSDPTGGRPFAAELAACGAPMVVAMTGRVADRACRLFATAFYRALLDGKDPVQAAAYGRRAGFMHGEGGIDWALPAMFVAEKGVTQFAGIALAVEPGATRTALMEKFAKREDPAGISDRLKALVAFQSLLHSGGPPALALECEQVSSTNDHARISPQLGRSRILREFGRQAIRSGHLPVLVTTPKDETPTIAQFCGRLRRELDETFQRMQQPTPRLALRSLALALAQPDAPRPDLPPEVAEELLIDGEGDTHPFALRAALRLDFGALSKAYMTRLPDCRPPRVVVLLDDAERLGERVLKTLEGALTTYGLGEAAAPVPLVLACDLSRASGGEFVPGKRALEDLLGRHDLVQRETLSIFGEAEWRAAYEVWLLNCPKPLALMRTAATVASADDFLKMLHIVIGGRPVLLPPRSHDDHESIRGNKETVAQVVAYWQGKGILVDADDELRLRDALAVAR